MSDRSYVIAEVFGVAGHEEDLANLFSYFGFHAEDAKGKSFDFERDNRRITDGVRFIDYEARIGVDGEITPKLRELAVTYSIAQDAKYEYSGYIEMFAPDLGVFGGHTDEDAWVTVPESQLDLVVDESRSLEELKAVIDRLSGRQWRRRFTELRDAAKAKAA